MCHGAYKPTGQTDTSIVQMIYNIAEQCGCRVTKIDWENRVIDLTGSDAEQRQCARMLADMLEEHIC